MANHLVSGQRVPDAVSGHIALEIANTRAGWGQSQPREYLVSYDALAVWACDVGLLSAAESRAVRGLASGAPVEAGQVVDGVKLFRESFYSLLTAGSPVAAELAVVHAAAAPAYAASALVAHPDGRVLPDGGGSERGGIALPLHRVALAGAALLAAGDAPYVRACEGRGCGWLFLDRSQRRRWCIMAVCGNRAKARAYAARRRGAA